MTGRTHDLAAFTALSIYIATQPTPQMTLATAVSAFIGNMIGGLLPDIDDATSDFWDTVRLGDIVSKIINPLIGSHRKITHSFLGLGLAGLLLHYLLTAINKVLIVDMNIVWWSIMLGYLSHLIMDSFTKEGVPWLLPIPIRIGFPPFKFLRITTGKLIEHMLVFPGLIFFNAYLVYKYYPIFITFFRSVAK